MSSISFSKYHGCGNHFIIIKDLKFSDHDLSRLAKDTSSPQYAVGSDGLMVVGEKVSDEIKVRMYNPDGSRMGMCGNGIRCVMRFCYEKGILDKNIAQVVFNVHGKKIVCKSNDFGKTVTVNMGRYEFQDPINVSVNNKIIQGVKVSVGNPHFVVLDEPVDIPLMRELETNQAFPDRANIEFVEVLSKHKIKVVVWERGAGQTLACGTGASASAVVAFHSGRSENGVEVELPGGTLKVKVDDKIREVYLTGPAEFVFDGTLSEKFSV